MNEEGSRLLELGELYYYRVRDRFNKSHDPLDFLFLNRAGFNGMIRFNRRGELNVPFCRRPSRFSQSYITKIVHQIAYVYELLMQRDYQFICQDFEESIRMGSKTDWIYCDPPYIGRHVDYYNSWNEQSENRLYDLLSDTKSHFMLSTWYGNRFRKNHYLQTFWKDFHVNTREHFYHLGAREKNRNPMIEALISNYNTERVI